MKNINIKNVLVYSFLIIYIIVFSILLIDSKKFDYNYIVNPLFWMNMFIFSLILNYSEKRRLRAKTEKTQTVLIITMLYLFIYFFLGIFFGYERSPYSHELISVIKNIWGFVIIIFFQEYIREAMLPSGKHKMFNYILIVLIFTCAEISFYKIGDNFVDLEAGFQYISSFILPVLVKNILFTYLAVVGGYGCNLCYRIPVILTTLFMPLFPNLEWFIVAIIDLLVPFITFLFINYIQERRMLRDSRRVIRKSNPIKQAPFIIFLLIFVAFVAGILTYMPVAIMSNSMADLIKRGDVVVVKKIKDEEKENLRINDIIEYKLDTYIVVHRIVDIKKTTKGEIYFITKGDHNNANDIKPVYKDQIISIVQFKVPKIGYAAVLLNEIFNKTKVEVET